MNVFENTFHENSLNFDQMRASLIQRKKENSMRDDGASESNKMANVLDCQETRFA